jgi:hypothetical protein
VVELVLHDAGEQPADVDSERLTIERPGVDHDLLRPPHVAPQSGQAEAALLLHSGAPGPAERRIDEDQFLAGVRTARRVDHEEPVGKGDLVGRQADPLGGVHDVEHLLDGGADLVVDPHERPRAAEQRGMRILHEVQRADGGGG